ncbi:MAG TPA: hypothetical protein VGG05_10645 [Pseudonocardiaceae bacterium]
MCAALGLPGDHAEAPTEPVTVGPALAEGAMLTTTVGFWQSHDTGDIAALWPDGELPVGAPPRCRCARSASSGTAQRRPGSGPRLGWRAGHGRRRGR